MEEIIVRLKDLPYGIVACTIQDETGFYNIYINSRHGHDMQVKGYLHEMEHINRHDWDSPLLISDIEREVRNAV